MIFRNDRIEEPARYVCFVPGDTDGEAAPKSAEKHFEPDLSDRLRIVKAEKGSDTAKALLAFVENCSWEETKEHIAGMLRTWVFENWETMFAACIDGKVVGMVSVMKTDYYPLPDIYPWISCLFVSEEVRGRGIAGKLISRANRYVKELGFEKSYIPTPYEGLYERYGYRFVGNIVNYGGDTDRLYVRELT